MRILLAILITCSVTAFGQNEKRIDSKISNVTVFLNKAQIFRKTSARIDQGKTNLIISGLSSSLDQQSIQVSGKGNFVIHGISHQQNYLSELNIPKPLRLAKDSLDIVNRLINTENLQRDILNKEEQLILSNQKIGGSTQTLTATELKAMADFFRSRLSEIVTSRAKIDERIKRLSEILAKLQRQVSEETELYQRNTSEIVVSLSAESAVSVDLELSYIVPNAGWQPVYDLRAINTQSPVTLIYKANVFQTTGEDWKNVRMRLSTANPSMGGQKPQLNPWYVDFYYPREFFDKRKSLSATGAVHRAASEAPEMDMVEVAPAPAQSTTDLVTTIETTLNTEFDIALPYTVTSSSKPTLVDVKTEELKTSYVYATAPKSDRDAFLIGRATNWENLSLLPGEANIFFEGTYVGKTFIDPNSIRDTLQISLGRDKRIVVTRERLTDLTTRKTIGTSQRETFAFEISVRNTKSQEVTIVVEDQIPVSKHSQIEVIAGDLGGAKYEPVSGKLTWELKLKPNETKKVTYRFEVKYPRDKTVEGLR